MCFITSAAAVINLQILIAIHITSERGILVWTMHAKLLDVMKEKGQGQSMNAHSIN